MRVVTVGSAAADGGLDTLGQNGVENESLSQAKGECPIPLIVDERRREEQDTCGRAHDQGPANNISDIAEIASTAPNTLASRSMLQTAQRFPRAGSQSYPSPAAAPNEDGSTTIYFGPKRPQDVKEGNWIQTDPKEGWFTILRLYSPLQSFFDKSWRPGEFELAK